MIHHQDAVGDVFQGRRRGCRQVCWPAIAMAMLALVCATGCVPDDLATESSDVASLAIDDVEVEAAAASGNVTVASLSLASGKGSCSTKDVMPLAMQIADRVVCMAPDKLVHFAESKNVRFSGPQVMPFIDPEAAAELTKIPFPITVNNAFRTVAQQYILRDWMERGRCRISKAAKPGRSNHESGRAMDVSNYSEMRKREVGSWKQTVKGDPVHFDRLDSKDNRGLDTLAFQQLWNLNNPDDKVEESGVFDTATGLRLAKTPVKGFADVGKCQVSPLPDGPFPDQDSVEDEDDDGEITGGCAAAPASAMLPWALVVVAGRKRRRQRAA